MALARVSLPATYHVGDTDRFGVLEHLLSLPLNNPQEKTFIDDKDFEKFNLPHVVGYNNIALWYFCSTWLFAKQIRHFHFRTLNNRPLGPGRTNTKIKASEHDTKCPGV